MLHNILRIMLSSTSPCILKSKKLEEDAKNTLKSCHCTATLIRRAMECWNVIVIFQMLFMSYHLERKNTPHSPNVWLEDRMFHNN